MKKKATPRTRWPMPPEMGGQGPRFLFIFTLPYSGSTALSQLLNTSNRSMLLHETGEGQWLIAGLCDSSRWRLNKNIEWESIRRVWLKQWRKTNSLVGGIEVVIEKSPPNLVRMDGFLEQFPKHVAIAFNRNPYAFAASYAHRHHKIEVDKIAKPKRREFFRRAAKLWVGRSRTLMDGIERNNLVNFAYEELCANPAKVIKNIQSNCAELTDVDPHAKLRVKNYEPQPIVNQNSRQMEWLTQDDAKALNSVMRNHEEILAYFGYELMDVQEFSDVDQKLFSKQREKQKKASSVG